MKKWLLIGGGLVVVILAGLFYLYSSLGSLVKAGVEKYGSEITQAKVRLNAAEVSATLRHGRAAGDSMRRLRASNENPRRPCSHASWSA